jgi:hypothetical protein
VQKSFIPKNAYRLVAGFAAITVSLGLAGCAPADQASIDSAAAPTEVVLATHDSFTMSDQQAGADRGCANR